MTEAQGSVDAGNPEAAPAEAPPAQQAPEAAPAAPSIPEYLSGLDEDTIAWAATKNMKGPQDFIRSYRNLEKMFGAEKAGRTVALPTEGTSPEELGAFYEKLGRPATDDQYSFSVDGADADRLGAMRKAAFEAGITDAQFTKLAETDMGMMTALQEQMTQQTELKQSEAREALKKEWGAAYEKNLEQIDAASDKLGFTPDQISALRDAMGIDGAAKFIYGTARKLGEHSFDGPSDRSDGSMGVMTPASAKAEMQKLQADPEWFKAWTDKHHPGHAHAVARKEQLSKYMAGVSL